MKELRCHFVKANWSEQEMKQRLESAYDILFEETWERMKSRKNAISKEDENSLCHQSLPPNKIQQSRERTDALS